MRSVNLFQVIFSVFLRKIFTISWKIHLPKFLQKIFFSLHYKYVNYLLNPYFYKASKYINDFKKFKGYNNSNIIWMFWWQGLNNMPHVVKECIRSVKKNSNGHRVILISKYNMYKYAKLPKIIYKKVYNNKLDFTHFSDILRFNLLDQYGGLWVDSTMFCTSNITDKYFKYLYTTGGYKNTNPKFVKGRWAEFLIGGNSKNNALRFVDKFLQLYFIKNNKLPSYFLADYALDYSYSHDLGGFKSCVNNIAKESNPNLFKLVNILNNTFNLNEFKRLTINTNMFKLTYKVQFNRRKNTFYDKLINHN